jgi:CRISPR-associated protein Csm5
MPHQDSEQVSQHYTLQLTTLAPVHIGTGQDLDATRYVVDEQKLFELDPLAMMSLLNAGQRRALEGLCDDVPLLSGDRKRHAGQTQQVFVRLQRFFHEHRETLKSAARDIRPVSPQFERYYRDKLGIGTKPNERARLEIAATLTSPLTQQPVIPGSTLKGMLRTAITNLGAAQQGNSRDNAQAIEKRLLHYDKVDQDPFAGIKLADAMPNRTLPRQLLFAQQISRKTPEEANAGDSRNGFYKNHVLLEAIPPFAVRAFDSQLTVRRDFLALRSGKGDRQLATLTLNQAFIAQNRFAVPQLETELARLERQGVHQGCYCAPETSWIALVRRLLLALESPLQAGKAALVRLGHYAGAESKTWDGLRNIKVSPPGKTPLKFDKTPRTAWLAAPAPRQGQFGLPFGWVLVENAADPLEPELLAPLEAASTGWEAELDACRDQLATLRAARSEAMARQQRQEAELAEMVRAQQEKADRLEKLTPAGQAVEALSDKLANDQRFKINEPSGELRTLLNQAVAKVVEEGDTELMAETRELFTACCQLWGVDRKKNKKLKELWKPLND